MMLYIYYTFIENSKFMVYIKKYFCLIIFVLIIIFGFVSLANAQRPQMRGGPPIYCGLNKIINLGITKYNETEFSVLTKTTPNETYFILFRNLNTGSWTVVAYNVPNLSPKYSCIMLSGNSSFILPDMQELQKALDKQKEGLAEQIDPSLERES